MRRFLKAVTVQLIPLSGVLFLLSCASVQHQTVQSGDLVSADKQGIAYMKRDNRTPPRTDALLASAHNNRAMISLKEGNRDQALLDFDKAIEADPSFAPAYNSRAQGLLLQDIALPMKSSIQHQAPSVCFI